VHEFKGSDVRNWLIASSSLRPIRTSGAFRLLSFSGCIGEARL
jgi:hypothetical protein